MKEGNLYKGIVVLMVVGFKLSIPFVFQTIPEVTFNGQCWSGYLLITLTVS